MTPLSEIPARDSELGLVNVVVDTPRGSRNKYKYKYNEDLGIWRLSKLLPLGASFPFDFGFIPSTRGEDGDPIDALVLSDEPSFPGCVLPTRLIGALRAEQTEHGKTVRNDRLIAVIDTPHNPPAYHDLSDVDQQLLVEIEHFFTSYNELEGRKFKPLERVGARDAERILEEALAVSR